MNQADMSDAPLPFQARSASPIAQAVEQIEGQTRGVRQRSNRFTLADGAFVAAGALLLGCASLILLAFRLAPHSFAVAAWLVLAIVIGVTWRRVRRAKRSWMSSANVAEVIDERARLEDRLATLAATTEASRQSRLWAFLLRENLRLLPLWAAERFVPRAVPRSVWFFAIAMLIFLVACLQVPRASRGAADAPQEVAASAPPADGDSGADGEAGNEESPESMFGWADLPEAIRQAIVGSQASQNFAGKIPQKTAPVKDEHGGPAIVGERMANGGPVRSMPAGPNAPKPSGPPGAGAKVAPAPDPNAIAAKEPPPMPPLARGDAPKMLPPAQSGKQQGPTNKGGKGATGGGGGGGAGTGGDSDGLYGDKQSAGKYAGSFALDLDALRAGDPDATGDTGEPDARPEGRIAPDQRLDDAIRRAQVPVEYEKVVQRIFNRTSEEGTTP